MKTKKTKKTVGQKIDSAIGTVTVTIDDAIETKVNFWTKQYIVPRWQIIAAGVVLAIAVIL